MSDSSNKATSLRKRLVDWLPVILYVVGVYWPMPWYLTFMPAEVLLPLIYVISFLVVAIASKLRGGTTSMRAWFPNMIGGAAVVILTYARALQSLEDARTGQWWLIGGGLVALWLASFVVLAISTNVPKQR